MGAASDCSSLLIREELGLSSHSIELSKHVLPLRCVYRHRALWNLQPEVVQNVMLFPRLHDLLQDLESHIRHRDSLGQLFFNDLEELIGLYCCLRRQGVSIC